MVTMMLMTIVITIITASLASLVRRGLLASNNRIEHGHHRSDVLVDQFKDRFWHDVALG
jgi:hypothetical protein